MPRPTPIPVRNAILRRWRNGQNISKIAGELGFSERTVRRLVERFRQRGDGGLAPDYHHPAPQPNAAQRVLYCAALDLRRAHPKWGAEYLRINLRRVGHSVPTARTIQRLAPPGGLGPCTRRSSTPH